jgi:RimJ/RimL family protein N-acetyltransferase
MQDLPRIHAWHNDLEIFESLSGTFKPSSSQALESWLQAKQTWSDHEINCAICLSDTGEHIGNIYLRDLNWVARRGELHIYIGERANRGLGYGEDAVRTLLQYAFSCLGLHRIFLSVMADNASAIRMYERCGFEREGILSEHLFKGNAHRDVLVMGLIAGRVQPSPAAQRAIVDRSPPSVTSLSED